MVNSFMERRRYVLPADQLGASEGLPRHQENVPDGKGDLSPFYFKAFLATTK